MSIDSATAQLPTRSVTHPTEQCQSLCRSSALHRYRPALRFGYLTDWLQARRQYATGQLDHGLPWFFSVLEQILSQYPKSTLQWMLFVQPSPKLTSKFWAKRHAPNRIKTCSFCRPPNIKSAQILHSSAAYCQQSTSHHLTVFTSQGFSLLSAYLYQKDGRALPENLQCAKLSWSPSPWSQLYQPSPRPFLLSLSLSLSRSCCSFKMFTVTQTACDRVIANVPCIFGTTWLAAVLGRQHPMTHSILRTWLAIVHKDVRDSTPCERWVRSCSWKMSTGSEMWAVKPVLLCSFVCLLSAAVGCNAVCMSAYCTL
jgi:hypothetical protein